MDPMERNIQEQTETRTAMLEGLAREFIDRMGCGPREVALIQQVDGSITRWWFEYRPLPMETKYLF